MPVNRCAPQWTGGARADKDANDGTVLRPDPFKDRPFRTSAPAPTMPTEPHTPQPPQPASAARIDLALGVSIARDELRYSFSRGGGPGGQNVNKVATRAELRIAVTAIDGLDDAALQRLRRLAGSRLTSGDEIVLVAQTHRSQLDNKQACLERLRELIERARVRPKPRKATKVSKSQKRKRLESKRKAGERKAGRRWRGHE
jgi:ribosome-associated protein